MGIRAKSTTIIVVAVFILLSAIYGLSKLVRDHSVNRQEIEVIEEKLSLQSKLIDHECASLNAPVSDWAIFDDTYAFMKDRSEEYLEANLQDTTFVSLRLNYVIFLDLKGRTVYEKGYNLKLGIQTTVPDQLHEYLTLKSQILKNRNAGKSVFGLIPVGDRILMVSSNPITTSDQMAAPRGTLVMARYLSVENLNFIEELTRVKVSLQVMDQLIGTKQQVHYLGTEKEIQIETIDEKRMKGWMQLRDINGKTKFLLGAEVNRTAYENSRKETKILVLILLGSLLLFLAIFLMLIQKIVIHRIVNLNRFVKMVAKTGDKQSKIVIEGTDEIASLSKEIHRMLQQLHEADTAIQDSKQRLEMVLEGSNDGFWDWNMNADKVVYSERAVQMLGYRLDDPGFVKDILITRVHPDDVDGVRESLGHIQSGDAIMFGREYRILMKSGIWKWYLVRGKVVEHNEDGKPKRMAGTITDISIRKKTEEEIKYLSYNDKLTGLFNRAYFEKELEYVDSTSELPYSLIIGDLNGLKLTNDVFGHEEGDRLLVEIAEILKISCRESDVISRWGGDEFAILLAGADQEVAKGVCDRIKENCEASILTNIKPSIALGMATRTRQIDDTIMLIRDAEEKMYKNKAENGAETRMRILTSLMLQLAVKSYEDTGHRNKIRDLCVRFGESLQLSDEEIRRLLLLGEYHDIGEVTIPEGILKKPGKLAEQEWNVLKVHPETGYRIGKSIPEIAHIANLIMLHHEHFDGSGYPTGAIGVEIPLAARTFAVIDAFAAMTRQESYKQTLSTEEALQELKKYSGTWFDPVVVISFQQLFHDEIQQSGR